MKTLSDLSQERLKQLLSYDEQTGIFYWKINVGRHSRIKALSKAGGKNKEGYGQITIDKICYRTCRLAWLYIHGEWPKGQIDHMNRNTGDDRIENLRDVTQSENKLNCGAYKNNTSGFKRVGYEKGKKFSVRYKLLGSSKRLGPFNSAEEANEAYQKLITNGLLKFSIDDYNKILKEQNGCCAICKNPEEMIRKGKIQSLAVDHCHETGDIRGLLCTKCNNGLGFFKDSEEYLNFAALYIKQSKKVETKNSNVIPLKGANKCH